MTHIPNLDKAVVIDDNDDNLYQYFHDIIPIEFNKKYPNGIIINNVKRGNNACTSSLITHPAHIKGVALKPNHKNSKTAKYFPPWTKKGEIASFLISAGSKYDQKDKIRCVYNNIEGLYKITNKGLIITEKTDETEETNEINNMDNEDIAIYSGPDDISSSESKQIGNYCKHAEYHPIIRLVIYFGKDKARMWVIGYVRINQYQDLTKDNNPYLLYLSNNL